MIHYFNDMAYKILNLKTQIQNLEVKLKLNLTKIIIVLKFNLAKKYNSFYIKIKI